MLSLMTPFEWVISVVALSVAAWSIGWLRSHFREDSDDADGTLEMLTQFRDLHQEGGLSDDEFRSIRSRLSRRVQEVSATAVSQPNVNPKQSDSIGKDDLRDKTSEQLPTQQSTSEKVEQSDRKSEGSA